jgi:hypothetical protein
MLDHVYVCYEIILKHTEEVKNGVYNSYKPHVIIIQSEKCD